MKCRFQFCIRQLQSARRLFLQLSEPQLETVTIPPCGGTRHRAALTDEGRFRVKRCCLRRRALAESSRLRRRPLIPAHRAFEERPSFDGLWRHLLLPQGEKGVAPGADFSFASGDFNTLGAFFCNCCNSQAAFKLPHLSVSPIGQPPRVPDLVGSRLPSPYHFRARIQSFQAVAAPFPGGSVLPSASRAAIPPTETPRFKNQRSGSTASVTQLSALTIRSRDQ
jgi:hypothetical protein